MLCPPLSVTLMVYEGEETLQAHWGPVPSCLNLSFVDVGSGCAGQLGARRNRFPRIDHAVAVQVDEQRSLAAIVDGSELDFGGAVTHVAQVDGGRHPLDLAFDQAWAAVDGRRLVGGVDGDVDAAGGLRAAAVAHGDVEAVGIGRSEVAAVRCSSGCPGC